MVRGVPDLRFSRRRGIAYSFTGEKLTGEQISEAFETLRQKHPALRQFGVQLSCIPSRPTGATTPGYHLVLAHPGQQRPACLKDGSAFAKSFDNILAEINHEFAAKIASSRLASRGRATFTLKPGGACQAVWSTSSLVDLDVHDVSNVRPPRAHTADGCAAPAP